MMNANRKPQPVAACEFNAVSDAEAAAENALNIAMKHLQSGRAFLLVFTTGDAHRWEIYTDAGDAQVAADNAVKSGADNVDLHEVKVSQQARH